MKILYYSSHPNLAVSAPTGYGTHMREMIRAFEELGHEVIFYIGGEVGGDVLDSQAPTEAEPSSKTKSTLKALVPNILWETLKDIQLIRIDNQRKKRLRMICQENK